MSLDITQLLGLHPACQQHQPLRPVTERRSTAPVRKDLADVPNPWGITPGQAGVLDALIVHGSNKAAAIALGLTLKSVEMQVSAATRRMPHGPRLHKLMRWRDFRGLVQELKP
jgi:hypothetical protein